MASINLLDPRLRSPKGKGKETAPSQPQRPAEEEEDDSEWEYEYSSTQTDTFYVTLDLSKADFKPQDQVNKSQEYPSRGRWQVQATGFRKNNADDAARNSAASSANSSDAEHDDEDDDEDEDDRPAKSRKRKNRGGADEEDEDNNLEKVQILELHSENPIISYKGRVFSGQWHENITTELILTRSDEDDSLPILRHLGDGVDLLAASSCRIKVTEKKLKPKVGKRQRISAHLPQTIIPPVDYKSSQERIDQRNFLADLIALKRRKGETDDVTIIARSMQGRRRATLPPAPAYRRGRWAHPEKVRTYRDSTGGPPHRSGRRKDAGRARERGKWALFPLQEVPQRGRRTRLSSRTDEHVDTASEMSTPTPSHWNELEGGDQDATSAPLEGIEEADEEDEQDMEYDNEEDDEDGVEDDDNNVYDEDENEDEDEEGNEDDSEDEDGDEEETEEDEDDDEEDGEEDEYED